MKWYAWLRDPERSPLYKLVRRTWIDVLAAGFIAAVCLWIFYSIVTFARRDIHREHQVRTLELEQRRLQIQIDRLEGYAVPEDPAEEGRR